MFSHNIIPRTIAFLACFGLLTIMGCTPEVPQNWKDMGFPLGENTEVRASEEQNATQLSVDHRGTSAHQKICERYKAKLEELGYEQDLEAESKTDEVQVIRTMKKGDKTLRLACRDVADRAIVRMKYTGGGE